MSLKHQKNNNDDDIWDRESECSNVSANTDMKVFHGAIHSSDDYISKLSLKNKRPEIKGKQSHFSMFKKPISQSVNKQQQQQKSHPAIKEIINNDQLSFRNESDMINEEKTKQTVKQSSKSVDIKGLYDESEHLPQNKQNQNVILQNLILKFKDFSDIDSSINIPGANIGNLRKDNRQMQSKTYIKSTTSFRISSIEKGIALLVSNNDCIFTMPTFLLPKGAQIGYSYSLCIEETKKALERKNNMSLIQKSYLH